MTDIDTDVLQAIVLMMKDADVRRCRIGDIELEFGPPAGEAPQVEYVQVPVAKPLTDGSVDAPARGYSALLGANPPKFSKSEG